MSLIQIAAGLGGAIGAATFVARLIYKRFRKSGANEIEPFRRYAVQGLKYCVGRFMHRQLAAELTLRQYARLHLRNTAREMLVPARYPKHLDVDHVFVPLLLRGGGQDSVEYGQLVDQHSGRVLI